MSATESRYVFKANVDRTANSVLRTTAPETTRKLKGYSSLTFLLWYICISAVTFAALFWYFYSNNCSFRSEIIPNLQDYSFYDSYGSGRNYLCNSRIAMVRPALESWFTGEKSPRATNSHTLPTERITFYCLLGNFGDKDYGKFRYFIYDKIIS